MLTVCVAAAILSCDRTPEGVLKKDEMASLLADLHTAESYVENKGNFNSDSSRRALRQSIYARHGLTTAQAENSLRWYGYNMDKYIDAYDQSIEILEKRLEDEQNKAGSVGIAQTDNSIAMEGDSVDVWTYYRTRRFAANMPSDYVAFSLSSDKNWESGDVYTLKTRLHANQANADVNLAIRYQNGSTDYLSQKMMGDGWHEIRFAVDSARTASEIYGTISYRAKDGQTAFIDSITLVRTRWNPKASPSLRTQMKSLERKGYKY